MGEREDAVNAGRPAEFGGSEFADAEVYSRTADAGGDEADELDEAARLRSEIEQTRAGMGETIDAIQEKLSPENIKEQVMEQVGEAVQSAKDSVREATIGRVSKIMSDVGDRISDAAGPAVGRVGTAVRDTGAGIIDTVRENPLPAALIGLGVGMLVLRSRDRRSRYEYDEFDGGADRGYEGVRAASGGQGEGVLGRAKEAVADTVSSVRETAGSAVDQTREQVSRVGDQVQRGARRAGDQFQTQLRENPLAVGAVALALGAAVGLAAPSTRVENQYLGEARDKLVGKAEEAARGAMEKVQQVAQDAGRSLQGEGDGQGQPG